MKKRGRKSIAESIELLKKTLSTYEREWAEAQMNERSEQAAKYLYYLLRNKNVRNETE